MSATDGSVVGNQVAELIARAAVDPDGRRVEGNERLDRVQDAFDAPSVESGLGDELGHGRPPALDLLEE